MLTIPSCQPQAAGETIPGYASRVLRFGIRYGAEYLTQDQTAHADHAALFQIAALPVTLTEDQARTYQLLVRFRRALQDDQERRKAARLQDARALARYAAELDPDDETAPPAGAEPEDDQTRAIRLLRAALILVMDRPQGRQDGHGTRLQPPPRFDPTPGGNASAADPYEPARLPGGRF
jgi:hypothetical protein